MDLRDLYQVYTEEHPEETTCTDRVGHEDAIQAVSMRGLHQPDAEDEGPERPTQ